MVFDPRFNIGERHGDGNIDIPRMRDGGMDSVFFSIWVPSDVTGPIAVKRALDQIDAVREAVRQHPNDLVLATTAAEVRNAVKAGRIASLMGMEGGHMIDDDMRLLRIYAGLGVRYMTLTHFGNNNWADSSTDKPAHNGLTAFGKDVVREMNRLGMMVDISHVADKTFYDVMALTKAPVIASHSSCRAIANHPRNMTDEMLRDLAQNRGVCMINFFSAFLNDAVAQVIMNSQKRVQSDSAGGTEEMPNDATDWDLYLQWFNTLGSPQATLDDAADHVFHAAEVAGIDHVGIGSDYDGVPALPTGLQTSAGLPLLTARLLERGMSEGDVEKVLGGNFLRVFGEIEAGKRDG